MGVAPDLGTHAERQGSIEIRIYHFIFSHNKFLVTHRILRGSGMEHRKQALKLPSRADREPPQVYRQQEGEAGSACRARWLERWSRKLGRSSAHPGDTVEADRDPGIIGGKCWEAVLSWTRRRKSLRRSGRALLWLRIHRDG